MSDQIGYVKFWRSILGWEWYHDLPVRTLFLHLMVSANREQKRWQGQVIEPGSIATSLESLALSSGLSVREVRTAITKLKSTGEVGEVVTNKFRVVSLRKWAEYQQDPATATSQKQTSAKRATGQRQASDRPATTTEEVREEKKGRREEPDPNGSVANGQLPIEGMPVPDPQPPRSHRGPDPEVQGVIDHLRAKLVEHKIAPALDGSEAKNRQSAYNLIRKLRKDYPNFDPLDSARRLINYATADTFHGPKCTKVYYLLENVGKIHAEAQQKKKDPKKQTDEDRKLDLAERLAAYARESAGDVPAR